MAEFLDAWGVRIAVIISIVAFLQVWVIALIRFLWRRTGTVEIDKIGIIEIGYSAWGSTIGLLGTLRALKRDLFIRSIHLELEHREKETRHSYKFEWAVFKSTTIAPPEEMHMELAGGFLLRTSEPYRYNIQFHDVSLQQQIRPVLDKLKKAWLDAGEKAGIPKLLDQYTDPVERQTKIQEAARKLYPKFQKAKKGGHLEVYTQLKQLCYWRPGRYKLTMVVNTVKPNRQFPKTWYFTLKEEDVKNLETNTLGIMAVSYTHLRAHET